MFNPRALQNTLYSSVCFAATSPILGEEFGYQNILNSPPKLGGVPRRGGGGMKKAFRHTHQVQKFFRGIVNRRAAVRWKNFSR